MTRRLRTANYSQEARWRLGRAVKEARIAAGHRSRPSFYKAAGIGKRSLEAVESEEPNAPSVGETILRAIGRALPTWTEDTPRIILEGGEIPANDSAPAEQAPMAPLDQVLTASVAELARLASLYAWYEGRRLNRPQSAADEERFMRWAMDVRAAHAQEGDIQPSGPDDGDGS